MKRIFKKFLKSIDRTLYSIEFIEIPELLQQFGSWRVKVGLVSKDRVNKLMVRKWVEGAID
jgi:hypothetical protein